MNVVVFLPFVQAIGRHSGLRLIHQTLRHARSEKCQMSCSRSCHSRHRLCRSAKRLAVFPPHGKQELARLRRNNSRNLPSVMWRGISHLKYPSLGYSERPGQCLLLCRFSDAGDDDRLCTLKRPAFEKRQGRKSRSVVRRRFGWLYGDLAGASGLGCVVMIHTAVRLDRDPAVNERVARRATRICGTSGCELSGSRRAWALSAASRQE